MKRLHFVAIVCLAWSVPGVSFADVDGNESKASPEVEFKDGRKMFENVKEMLLRDYFDSSVTEDDLYRAATQGMLDNLDRGKWNKLYSPSEYASLKSELSGEIVGVGLAIKVDEESGITDVLGVITGAPAEKAGVLIGDKILAIDGRTLKAKSLQDVVNVLRGKAGTQVKLTVLRGDEVRTIKLQRDRLTWNAVDHAVLEDQIGLIVIRSFQANTTKQLKAALESLKKEKVRGIVLDLRSNSGGKLEVVAECAEMFLPKGKTIVTVIKHGDRREEIVSKSQAPFVSVPLALLVNKETSSGAEILSAALKNGLSAQLVGEQTFGKWNVQNLEELPNKFAFKYTSGVFLSPDGVSFHGRGMQPDVPVSMGGADLEKLRRVSNAAKRITSDAQLRAAHSMLKQKI